MLEKAWAKVKGNYVIAEGGYLVEGMKALAGVPGYSYKTEYIGTDSEDDMTEAECFDMLKEADEANYIMAFGTDENSSNPCGICQLHAYTIISAFEMTDASDVVHQMLTIRNPWGTTDHTGPKWQHDDSAWTDALIAQVPLGINPTTAHE